MGTTWGGKQTQRQFHNPDKRLIYGIYNYFFNHGFTLFNSNKKAVEQIIHFFYT